MFFFVSWDTKVDFPYVWKVHYVRRTFETGLKIERNVTFVSCDRSLRFSFIIESQIFSIPWPNWTEVCAKKENIVKLPFLRCPGSEQILRRAFLCLASTQLNRPGNVLAGGCFEGKFKRKSSIQGVCICRRYVLSCIERDNIDILERVYYSLLISIELSILPKEFPLTCVFVSQTDTRNSWEKYGVGGESQGEVFVPNIQAVSTSVGGVEVGLNK